MRKITLLCLTILVSGCTEKKWLDFQIPIEAKEQYQGHPFSKFQRQTSFTHFKEYPDTFVLSEVRELLSSDWERCEYGGNKWSSFQDATSKPVKKVFQRIQTWRTKDKNQLVFVTLRYQHDSKNVSSDPENNSQIVNIIEEIKPWWAFWENFNEFCEV